MKNIELERFLRQSKRELKYTVPHRQGIILGYLQVNLDALLKEGVICGSEKQVACYELDNYYQRLNKEVKNGRPQLD